MRFVVIANPASNRVQFFNEALASFGLPEAIVVPWADFLEGRVSLTEVLQDGDVLRIESPGRDATVDALLVGAGREAERGEIFFPKQWYRGFCAALTSIQTQLSQCPPHRLISNTEEIKILFDKTQTQARFGAAGLPIPRVLGEIDSLATLAEKMQQAGVRQAFVKLAHGSSASGAVAIRTNGNGRWRAYTTVERVGTTLYNSRKIRVLDDMEEMDTVLRLLAPHTLHSEEWLPKAAIRGKGFDVRALVIAGKLRHVVARLSHSPMTNLHLLNERADADTVREAVGEAAWESLHELCERAALVFPKSLQIGLDIMWLPGFRRMALLEANAFGDLLPGTCWQGQTTYQTQISEVLAC
jgi:hypothetical protein